MTDSRGVSTSAQLTIQNSLSSNAAKDPVTFASSIASSQLLQLQADGNVGQQLALLSGLSQLLPPSSNTTRVTSGHMSSPRSASPAETLRQQLALVCQGMMSPGAPSLSSAQGLQLAEVLLSISGTSDPSSTGSLLSNITLVLAQTTSSLLSNVAGLAQDADALAPVVVPLLSNLLESASATMQQAQIVAQVYQSVELLHELVSQYLVCL